MVSLVRKIAHYLAWDIFLVDRRSYCYKLFSEENARNSCCSEKVNCIWQPNMEVYIKSVWFSSSMFEQMGGGTAMLRLPFAARRVWFGRTFVKGATNRHSVLSICKGSNPKILRLIDKFRYDDRKWGSPRDFMEIICFTKKPQDFWGWFWNTNSCLQPFIPLRPRSGDWDDRYHNSTFLVGKTSMRLARLLWRWSFKGSCNQSLGDVQVFLVG